MFSLSSVAGKSIVLLAVAFFCCAVLSSSAQPDKESQAIDYKDLIKKVQIIGKSKRQLGDIVTLRGKWVEKNDTPQSAKFVGLWFEVDMVNGYALDSKVSFFQSEIRPIVSMPDSELKPVLNQTWEFRGIESGRIVGVPNEVYAELPLKGATQYGYGFLPEFRYLQARVVGN